MSTASPPGTADERASARLYDAASGWWWAEGPREAIVEAACEAVVAGVDGMLVAELAGLNPRDSWSEMKELLEGVFSELGFEWPPEPWETSPFRPALLPARVSSFALQVGQRVHVRIDGALWIGRVDTALEPHQVFSPHNRLIATETPKIVAVATCIVCGQELCNDTRVRITRDDGLVVWEWISGQRISQRHAFRAEVYDEEVARAAANPRENPDDCS